MGEREKSEVCVCTRARRQVQARQGQARREEREALHEETSTKERTPACLSHKTQPCLFHDEILPCLSQNLCRSQRHHIHWRREELLKRRHMSMKGARIRQNRPCCRLSKTLPKPCSPATTGCMCSGRSLPACLVVVVVCVVGWGGGKGSKVRQVGWGGGGRREGRRGKGRER